MQPSHPDEMKILFTSGLFGSLVKLLLHPEKRWQRWVVQFAVGVIAAVFLGGILGDLIMKITGSDSIMHGYAAAGFTIGNAAERAIAVLQDRVLGKRR